MPIATVPGPGVGVAELSSREEALAWFVAEHQVLMAVLHQAASAGLHTQTWQLALLLAGFLDNQGHWHDWITAAHLGVEAARQVDDPAVLARAHRILARGYAQLGSYPQAQANYEQALNLYARIGDDSGQASTHFSLSWMTEMQGHHHEALHHALRSLKLFEAAGHLVGQARALNATGWSYACLGDYRQTLDYCNRALALQQQLGDADGQAATWDSIGYAHHRLGEPRLAIACYQDALDLYRRCGDRYNEADVLTHLGEACQSVDDLDAARAAWRLAADILDDLGHADADAVRDRLSHLGRNRTPDR
jgi:tetratricopeptide (TPR) repeat protein